MLGRESVLLTSLGLFRFAALLSLPDPPEGVSIFAITPPQSSTIHLLEPLLRRNWEIAEFEVYGGGFVEQTVFTTRIMDFGRPVSWSKIRWDGEMPPGTRVEVRTRTGDTIDPNIYLAENPNGDVRPIPRVEYERIDVSGRLPTSYDRDNWSFWSPPYDFEAGLRDDAHGPTAWRDGTPILSPGPSRYIQIDIRLFARFGVAPRLDQLSLQFAEVPAAQRIVGEIWPIEVDSFKPATFTYVVSPQFETGDTGFDRLEILTTTRVEQIRSVRINDDRVDLEGPFRPEILDDRMIVAFPALREPQADSYKQIEIVFDATVLRFGTEFQSWVFDSGDPDGIRQRVAAGNATFQFPGNVLAVQTPLGGDLLIQVEATPNPFTPNGDGVNDELWISYALRQVTAGRPLTLRIYDLAGALVHAPPAIVSTSGRHRQTWNGRGDTGLPVPPGLYLYELTLESGEHSEHRVGSVAVAY